MCGEDMITGGQCLFYCIVCGLIVWYFMRCLMIICIIAESGGRFPLAEQDTNGGAVQGE